MRKGVSRFVLCVPPVYRAIFVVSKCSIQSEYLNNKQFDGSKLKTDSWVSDNALRALQAKQQTTEARSVAWPACQKQWRRR